MSSCDGVPPNAYRRISYNVMVFGSQVWNTDCKRPLDTDSECVPNRVQNLSRDAPSMKDITLHDRPRYIQLEFNTFKQSPRRPLYRVLPGSEYQFKKASSLVDE